MRQDRVRRLGAWALGLVVVTAPIGAALVAGDTLQDWIPIYVAGGFGGLVFELMANRWELELPAGVRASKLGATGSTDTDNGAGPFDSDRLDLGFLGRIFTVAEELSQAHGGGLNGLTARTKETEMRYTRIATGAMVSAVALVGWWGGSASAGPDNKNTDSQVVTMDCGDEDTVVYSGPLELWPPNHKLQPADITATDGGEDNISDATMLDVGDIVPTDMVGGDGGSNHDPDVTYPDGPVSMGDPRATVSVELRSERSGRGEDRTYTINWIAVFDGGEKTCTSADDGQAPFVITVPHDGRRRS